MNTTDRVDDLELDLAAKEYAKKTHPNNALKTFRVYCEEDFKAGAEWQQSTTPTIQLEEGELGKVNMSAEQIEEFKRAMFNQPIQWHNPEKKFSLKDIEDAYHAGLKSGYDNGIKGWSAHPNKEQYINSINKVKDGNE